VPRNDVLFDFSEWTHNWFFKLTKYTLNAFQVADEKHGNLYRPFGFAFLILHVVSQERAAGIEAASICEARTNDIADSPV